MKLHKIVGFFLLITLAGCGLKGPDKSPWPASVHFAQLSETETESITASLKTLSKEVGTDLFYFDDRPNQFQITVTKMGATDISNSKAGLATYNETYCKVQLNEIVLDDSYSFYLKSVLWHEIGHCSGMSHNTNSGEIMYYIASPFESYTAEAFSNFFQSILSFTSLSK